MSAPEPTPAATAQEAAPLPMALVGLIVADRRQWRLRRSLIAVG